MKEIPILFSTPMVQAILEGRKSQTRRLVKEEIRIDKEGNLIWGKWNFGQTLEGQPHYQNLIKCKCPYGHDGDLFYVREEHYRYGHWIEKEGEYTETGLQKIMFIPTTNEVRYFNNRPDDVIRRDKRNLAKPGWYKRLARFMPKSAARIWLQKTATKVERACDISREDAIAEGLACISKDGGRTYKYGIPDLDGLPGIDDIGWAWQDWNTDPVEAFKSLWWLINGAETWNDWVWANSFKTLSTTGKPDLQSIKAV